MGTDDQQGAISLLLSSLASPEWGQVLKAVNQTEKWLLESGPGAPGSDEVVEALVTLSRHPKWEVRRAVAVLGGDHRVVAGRVTEVDRGVVDGAHRAECALVSRPA